MGTWLMIAVAMFIFTVGIVCQIPAMFAVSAMMFTTCYVLLTVREKR